MGRIHEREWVWHFDRPVEAMWDILADTARFNEAAKLPKHEIIETPRLDGSVEYRGRIRRGPLLLEWEERPVNWIYRRWFEHCRDFRNGPLRTLCASLTLEPEGEGCRGTYRIAVEPRNLLGRLILAGGFFRNAGRNFGQLAQDAGDFAAGRREEPFHYDPPSLGEETRRRLDAIVQTIEATPNGHGLGRQLADHVTNAQEVDLWHLRPLALARNWKRNPRDVIETCLQAVKSGLLELRWDLLCPRCRVAKAWTASLDRLPTGAHCPTCNIDYERDFSKNVEAAFRPAAAIRPLVGGEYCLFGPMSTPHIKLHITLAPGESRSFAVDLPFGPYRLRTLEPGPEAVIEWTAGGFPEVVLERNAVRAGAPAAPGMVTLTNHGDRQATAIVEDRRWLADALTADRITAIQTFRDLFASDVLRPGDEVAIGEVALMFTDLKGSTAFYERVGDARAYTVVRDHFAFLAGIVREHEGAIVKTIGDAVMAAFADPAAAVRAAIATQRKVAAFNAGHGEGAITIKLGLHLGPCIAVTLNDRLDYFGSTVNLAARLQGESTGGDIVISERLATDPAVRELLTRFALTDESAEIRGFDRPARFRRLTDAAIAAAPAEAA